MQVMDLIHRTKTKAGGEKIDKPQATGEEDSRIR